MPVAAVSISGSHLVFANANKLNGVAFDLLSYAEMLGCQAFVIYISIYMQVT